MTIQQPTWNCCHINVRHSDIADSDTDCHWCLLLSGDDDPCPHFVSMATHDRKMHWYVKSSLQVTGWPHVIYRRINLSFDANFKSIILSISWPVCLVSTGVITVPAVKGELLESIKRTFPVYSPLQHRNM